VIPVTLIVRHNEALELNCVDYLGAVSMAELAELAKFNAANPTWVTYDCLSVVAPGADFLSVNFRELDALLAEYRAIYQPLNFLILRRAAWLCLSDAALPHVRHWTRDPADRRVSMSSDVRLFSSYAEAAEWLLLRPAELPNVESGEGFTEIFRSEAPAAAFSR
jgi:hypothetical protein